ncbi:alpha-mannosidase [Microbacterium sp. NPDC091313]
MPVTDDLLDLRITRFRKDLLEPAVYRWRRPLLVEAWEAPSEPVAFSEAAAQRYSSIRPGGAWGKPWGTTWFRLSGEVPRDIDLDGGRLEAVIDLGFTPANPGFQAEGLVWSSAGEIIRAVEPRNLHVSLPLRAGDAVDLYVEGASNPDLMGSGFAETPLGDRETAGEVPLYRLGCIDLVVRDDAVWSLLQDVRALDGLWRVLTEDSPRRARIRRALELAIDAVDPDMVTATATRAAEVLAPVLASPAEASAHRAVAVGHAHIDSAWLWPVRETIRKCARTFSNVLALMEEDDDFVFACSSAQQYAWMKEHYPSLFERIKERVAEGRFVPVGGMWVESDTNLPGGEAMARQFIVGKSFFLREFGIEPREVWLPDSFGYSGALPQIASAAGAEFFLTQKSSWNETNTMPHHTFSWEGIDGTRLFSHFPPVDTYNAELSAAELARAQRQFQEKGEADSSLIPFGYGNGGGGPTREMLAAAHRTRDLEGSPRVELGSPQLFFERAQAELPEPPVWSGEIYLEFHRGTYTSQARTKRGNRRCEHLLREAELWATVASLRTGAEYPIAEIEEAWHIVLLQQFHDILPGSSIAWVYQVAEEHYARIARILEGIITTSLEALVGVGDAEFLVNAGPYAIDGVEAMSAALAPASTAPNAVVRAEGDGYVLENSLLRVTLNAQGTLSSIFDLAARRELVPRGESAAALWIYRDTPAQWDAWDVDVNYQRHGEAISHVDTIEIMEGDAVGVRVTRTRGASTYQQEFTLRGGRPTLDIVTRVDWHERRKLLKLAFPLDVHAERSTSEIQFGHIHRPTHANTSWDTARFETSAQRWVHVGEPGYGVAIANDQTYGHDITRTSVSGHGTTTLVRESLLRAPTFPDPLADQGRHEMRTSVRVGAETLDAAEEGYRLNLPLRRISGGSPIEPLFRVDQRAVVIEAVKQSEDRSGDIIVRLYEARGAKARATVSAGFEFSEVRQTDLLERDIASSALESHEPGRVRLTLRPFQIVTLRFRPEARTSA